MAEALEQRIIRLREELEGFKTALDRAEGSLETGWKQLKDEFKHTNLEDAADDLLQLDEDISRETEALEKAVVQLNDALQKMRAGEEE